MAEPLTTHLGLRDFDPALVADHAAVLHALVLAAQTFPGGDGSEDPGTKQTIALRLKGAVIDRFRLGNFAVRPPTDLFGRSQRDANRLKVRRELRVLLMKSKHFISP